MDLNDLVSGWLIVGPVFLGIAHEISIDHFVSGANQIPYLGTAMSFYVFRGLFLPEDQYPPAAYALILIYRYGRSKPGTLISVSISIDVCFKRN